MAYKAKKTRNRHKKSLVDTQIRKKLGVTQSQLASMLNVSRAYVSLVELNIRNGNPTPNTTLANIFLHFHELETGKQLNYRTLETRLFLNNEYKKLLPKMEAMENSFRERVKRLKLQLEKMKERACDAEHAIIVYTAAVNNLAEKAPASDKKNTEIYYLNLLKEKAYDKLMSCWEPVQAKLHARIESSAGKARALRRYRIKVVREHNPFKETKRIRTSRTKGTGGTKA